MTRILVTGATAGIGYFIAEQLAGQGATVVLGARSPERADTARSAILAAHPGATLEVLQLDLGSLGSIATAGYGRVLDGLVLNGATMRVRRGDVTADGLDPIMATSHLGNAALIEAAMPALERSPRARIVGTTSGLVRRMKPEVPPMATLSLPLASASFLAVGKRYVRAKAAHEAYIYELDRRLRAANSSVVALLSHPWVALDSRSPVVPGIARGRRRDEPLLGFVGIGKDVAARVAVHAATAAEADGGQYWEPVDGVPALGSGHESYRSVHLGARVWHETQELLATLGTPQVALGSASMRQKALPSGS